MSFTLSLKHILSLGPFFNGLNLGRMILNASPTKTSTLQKRQTKILDSFSLRTFLNLPSKTKACKYWPCLFRKSLQTQKRRVSDQDINGLCLIKYLQAEPVQGALFFFSFTSYSLCSYSILIFFISFFPSMSIFPHIQASK